MFFRTNLFCLHETFQVLQSSPSGFFWSKNSIFFIIDIFLEKYLPFCTSQKKDLSDISQKWAEPRQLQLKIVSTHQLLIVLFSCIVLCSNMQLDPISCFLLRIFNLTSLSCGTNNMSGTFCFTFQPINLSLQNHFHFPTYQFVMRDSLPQYIISPLLSQIHDQTSLSLSNQQRKSFFF